MLLVSTREVNENIIGTVFSNTGLQVYVYFWDIVWGNCTPTELLMKSTLVQTLHTGVEGWKPEGWMGWGPSTWISSASVHHRVSAHYRYILPILWSQRGWAPEHVQRQTCTRRLSSIYARLWSQGVPKPAWFVFHFVQKAYYCSYSYRPIRSKFPLSQW